MRAVFAGNVAEIAFNTMLVINSGDDLVIEIEISPIRHATNGFTDDFRDGRKTFFVQVIVQTVDHILDDPVAVMHDGGANLDISRA